MIQPQTLDAGETAALLHFYADAGVEWMLDEEAVDRFAEFDAEKAARAASRRPASAAAEQARPQQAQPQSARNAPAPRPQPTAPATVPDAEAVAMARQVAESARSLAELKAAVENFDHCILKRSARHSLIATGNPDCRIMIVGAIPGADEDRDGLPLSGRAGELFDRMLHSIGLDREKVVLTNALPWRPPGNRMPTPAEMDICRPFIERQLSLCAPRAVLLLGNFAVRYLVDSAATIHLNRGEWHSVRAGDQIVPALASLHPQDLLLAPANKRLAWQDLLAFRARLGELGLI